jgi:hypothetical protein
VPTDRYARPPWAVAIGLVMTTLSQGCGSADTREISNPETAVQRQIERGFAGDLGVGPTMGHNVPLEGEVISTPACVSEARGGQQCKD